MAVKKISDITTAITAWLDTTLFEAETAGGISRKIAMSVFRKIIPASDSTTAFQMLKADGSTPVLNVDTTNTRVGVGIAAPTVALDVVGAITGTGTGTFGTTTIGTAGDIELGSLGSGDRISLIDFHSQDGSDYDMRIVRYPGANGVAQLTNNGTGDIQLSQATNGSAVKIIVNTTERLSIYKAAIYFTTIETTASAGNAFLNSGASNQLLRSTSSKIYKTDIEDIDDEYAENIYKMRPVWYRSLCENDDKQWGHWGLIAEELAEVDPRLVNYGYQPQQFVDVIVPAVVGDDGKIEQQERTEKVLKAGEVMVPDGVQYDRLTVLLLKEIQKLNDRITALENK